ncbi:MAG: tryptophan synthase subunit alpha [Tropicimonas sp.]|uniref:tryptophan synthase subunit alpha n=1 Tax=Tropicimonas sp. TaxID=2067044 RepID=UPI003A8BC3B8
MQRPEATNPVRARLDALRGEGRKALCQFVIAGDPGPGLATDLALDSVAAGIDVIEFCIPFARSITDGPTIRAGYDRALAAGTTTTSALVEMARLAAHVPVVALADYRATVRPMGLDPFLDAAAGHGAGAVLLHGLPPLLQAPFCEGAAARGLGVVATAYPGSDDATITAAARRGTAFVYLVSSYGRSGGALDAPALADPIRRLRAAGAGPVGVGFGIRRAADHRSVFAAGADMTITGSAFTGLIAAHPDDPEALRRAWRGAVDEIVAARAQQPPGPNRRSDRDALV